MEREELKMKIEKTITVELTGKEYNLLRDAADLIEDILSKVDFDDFGEDYDLRGIEHNILAFLDDPYVEVEWAD